MTHHHLSIILSYETYISSHSILFSNSLILRSRERVSDIYRLKNLKKISRFVKKKFCFCQTNFNWIFLTLNKIILYFSDHINSSDLNYSEKRFWLQLITDDRPTINTRCRLNAKLVRIYILSEIILKSEI